MMTIQKIRFMAFALLGVTLCACQEDPSTSDLHRNYLVYTAHDTATDFSSFNTFYLPDSILLMSSADTTKYWTNANAQELISVVDNALHQAGYMRDSYKSDADLGIQISFVEQVTYFVGYNNPYWWWYYPYYWTPTYWGDWTGWHYPYQVYYGYTAGSMLIEMVDLKADQQSGKKLPVIWDSYIGGLLTSNTNLNQQRAVAALEQAFEQSPYLKK